LLLTALDNYRNSRHRFDSASKRSPGPGALTGIDAAQEVAAGDDPAASFDLAWARQVLDDAARSMREQCEKSGRLDIWTVFSERELTPAKNRGEPVAFDLLSRRLGLPTPTHARNLFETAKKMFRKHVELVVREYAADPREIEAEKQDLMDLAGRL
jgi:hypothetical protein